ncbi:hypothetical protein ACHWQZ_G007339 [Mnemiopsis leidyi]
MDPETLKKLQESVQLLLSQNISLNEKMEQIRYEKRGSSSGFNLRIEANMNKLNDLNSAALSMIQEMSVIKNDITRDGHHDFSNITWFYNHEDFHRLSGGNMKRAFRSNSWGFDAGPREEKLDMIFGQGGDYSASSLKRFIEKYRVVKSVNITAGHRGWESKDFRANKLKLYLQGDAFDFVTFDSSVGHDWTMDDEAIIDKLQDRYLNVQEIENNISSFENSRQGEKELLNDYMTRLKQLAKDAFEGETQIELDRKIAWRFLNGAKSEKVRRKLIEDGWMRNRREAKPLEEILKMAEMVKRTEDKPAISRPPPILTAYKEPEPPVNRVKKPSAESNHSNSTKSSGMDYLQCWYCDSKHKGGWRNCTKRKEDMSNAMGIKDKLNSLNLSKSAKSSRRGSVKDF